MNRETELVNALSIVAVTSAGDFNMWYKKFIRIKPIPFQYFFH
jgi:hypothetical protein